MKGTKLMLAALLALGIVGQSAAKENVIKLGAAISMTGKLAREGKYVKDGYEFWTWYVNEKLGGIKVGGKTYKLKLVFYDDESNANTAAKLVEKLITEHGIKFILGPYGSSATFATSAITEKYGAIMVEANGASDKIFTRGFKNLFAVLNVASQYLQGTIDMLAHLDPGIKKVAIVYEDKLFAKSVALGAKKHAEAKGWKVVTFSGYPAGTSDISSLLLKVKAKKPDVVLGSGHYQDGVLLVRQMKELRINVKAIGETVAPTLVDFVKNLGKDAEGVFGAAQWAPSLKFSDPYIGSTANFVKLFEQKYGYTPDYHVAESAAAVEVYQRAIEKAQSLDPKKVRDAIASLDFESFYGPIAFDSAGRASKKSMVVVQVQNGQQVVVWPQKVAQAKPIYPKPKWK